MEGKKKVLLTRLIPESCKQYLRDCGYEVLHTNDVSEENMCALVPDVDAILSRELTTTHKIMDAAKKLKIIARFGVGTDMLDLNYAAQKGIWVSITPLASARSVAEHAMALMLACAKQVVATSNEAKGGNWLYRNTITGFDLEGKTLGLVGLGKIGQHVARMAKAFDMHVLAYDKFAVQSIDAEIVDSLETLLSRSDIVSIHCPITDETRNLFSDDAFSRMKPGAVLINTARGGIVDEEALFKALDSGHLRAAGLDVSQKEPPLPDNPLLKLSNVVLTPHMAAVTDEAMYRMGMHAAYCIEDVLSGRPPRWPANKPVFDK